MAVTIARAAARQFQGLPSRRPFIISIGRATSSTSSSGHSAQPQQQDPQAETNTWCRRAEDSATMETWARPIVESVVSDSSPIELDPISIEALTLSLQPTQLDLYRCRPRPEIFDLYADDAVFDDPAGVLRGRPAIRLAMEALPKIFATGEPRELEITYHPALIGGERNRFRPDDGGREQVAPQVRIALVQCYTWRYRLPFLIPPSPQGSNKDPRGASHPQGASHPHADMDMALPTVAMLTLDPETKRIVRHEDRWWGQPTTYQGPIPVLGSLHAALKRAQGGVWEACGRRYYG